MNPFIGLDRNRRLQALGFVIILVMFTPGGPLKADVDSDLFLFTTSVPPNVAIVLDKAA